MIQNVTVVGLIIMQVNQIQTAEKLTRQKKKKKKNNKQLFNYRPLKYLQYDSIKVTNHKGNKKFVETDVDFIQCVQNICKSQNNVLDQLIGQNKTNLSQEECQQIHHLALLHRKANKINHNSNLSKNDLKNHQQWKSIYCQCGCERFVGQTYPLCYDIQDLNFLGSGILLFFNLIKGLFINMIILVTIYAFYAVIKNSEGDYYLTNNPSQSCISSYCQFKDKVSSFNLPDPNYVADVMNWMGLSSMCIWILISRFLKYYCFYKDKLIDQNLKSSSDYAVKIDNLPYGDYNEEDLFQFLEQIYERKIDHPQQNSQQILQVLVDEHVPSQTLPDLTNLQPKGSFSMEQFSKRILKGIKEEFQGVVDKKNRQNHFNIRSIQIIYRMDFCRKIITKIVDQCMQLSKLLKKQQDKYQVANKQKYLQLKKSTIEIYETLEDMRKKFLNDSNFRKKIATRAAIVEFHEQQDKIMLLNKFGHQNMTLLKRIKERFKQWWNGTSTLIFKGQMPIIKRAPQPSDILWQNCQKQFSYVRLFGIFIVTSLVILTSLGAIAGLRALQFYLKDIVDSQGNEDTTIKIFNFLTSIVLIIINAILWVMLTFLLDYEYNHTYTEKIISQINKSSPATWINTIIIPIIVNYVFYNRYYGADGVSGLAFDYQVTALAISLPLMVINPVEAILVVCLKIKCIRHYLIKSRYRKRKDQSDEQIEKEMMDKVYKLYSSPQFVIEQAYTFILTNVMHALFFCQLQPFILILVCIQIFLFYWACKIRVLRICKIPALIDRLVFQVAIYQMMLAPVFYGVGCIYNSYVSYKLDNTRSFNFVASSVCIGIGLLNYINPGDFTTKIVEKITGCFDCLKKENVFKDLRQKKKLEEQEMLKKKLKDEQLKKKNGGHNQFKQQKDQNKRKEVLLEEEDVNFENVRLENYYKNSNCLTLLGFQRAIYGQSSNKEIQFQFQNFCKSHIQRTLPNAYHVDEDSRDDNREQKWVEDYQQIQVQKGVITQ